MQYFDTHAHIGLIHDDPIEQLIVTQEARQASVVRIVSICNSLRDFSRVYENLKSASNVFHAVGVSPSEVQNPGKDWIQTIEHGGPFTPSGGYRRDRFGLLPKFGDKKSQIRAFYHQLELAGKLNLPVVIHNRDAGHDVLDILRERLPPQRRGSPLLFRKRGVRETGLGSEFILFLRRKFDVPKREEPPRNYRRSCPWIGY